MLKLGVLCSGGLGYSILLELNSNWQIEFVMTDKKSQDIIAHCKELRVPCFIGNPRKGRGYDFIKEKPIDVLVSINYLFLIEDDIIHHPRVLAFNIHGSLLPKYRGRTPHVWAIINNESETGITAHKIEVGCDTGAIIQQVRIKIEDKDTGFDILEKYRLNYFPLVQKVLQMVETNTIKLSVQNEEEATMFGKRTPEDGLIDWNWQKERIRNWVRAQAYPYPGAFTYYDKQKVIIDEVAYTNSGFNSNMKNGLILAVKPKLEVKTPNGALVINKMRGNYPNFEIGKIFNNEDS
jgi:methionyl-tRNA formyltransferase